MKLTPIHSTIASAAVIHVLLTNPISAINGDPAKKGLSTFNGWKTFEVVTQGDRLDGAGYRMKGQNDGIGAYQMDNGDLRVFINHEGPYACESAAATVSELIIDKSKLALAINNAIADKNGLTGGIRFIKSMDKAYDTYRTKEGVISSINENGFIYFCSGQVHEPNTFGPNMGFVDRVYIFGEEVANGRIFALANKTLHMISGVGSGNAAALQGGTNGFGFDALENAAMVSTGEENHVALFLSPDYGSQTLRMYIGKKGFGTDGKSCGACAGDENYLARNGLAFGSWFYLQGKLPSSGSSTGMKFGTDSRNAIQYAKHEDVDTNPMEPTKVILANQLEGVFEFEFDLNFDSDGAFSSATSGFQITKRLTTNQVGDPDNVEWAADGSFFVNSDNNAGDITHIQTDGGMTKIAQTVNSGESSGILDVSHFFNYAPATILLANSMACPLASLNLLINPLAPLTDAPTENPSVAPSMNPSQEPSTSPTFHPTVSAPPSNTPSMIPSDHPSTSPAPSKLYAPSASPSMPPSKIPTSTPSSNPSEPPTKSPSVRLAYIGNDGAPSAVFPLGRCEGDCDSDSECQVGLTCFQRSGFEAVPGCLGDGDSGTDYCFERPSNYLWLLGNKGKPVEVYPLKVCEGNCRNDSECADGLFCFFRRDFEAVPGCEGDGIKGKDYCYDPNPNRPTLAPTSAPTNSPTRAPTKDPSSRPSSVPSSTPSAPPVTSNPSSEPTSVPSAGSSAAPSATPSNKPSSTPSNTPSSTPSTKEPSAIPSQLPTISPPPSQIIVPSVFPSNSPSISSSVNPSQTPSKSPSLSPSVHPSTFPSSLPSILPSAHPSRIPSKSPTLNPSVRPSATPTKTPTTTLPLAYVGDNGSPPERFPLGKCEGDCDGHSDCKIGLLCYQRANTEPVPGCEGLGESAKDYCYDPNPNMPTSAPTTAPTPSPTPTDPRPTPNPSPRPTSKPVKAKARKNFA